MSGTRSGISIMQQILKSFEELLLHATREGDMELVDIMMRDKFFLKKENLLSDALTIAVQMITIWHRRFSRKEPKQIIKMEKTNY